MQEQQQLLRQNLLNVYYYQNKGDKLIRPQDSPALSPVYLSSSPTGCTAERFLVHLSGAPICELQSSFPPVYLSSAPSGGMQNCSLDSLAGGQSDQKSSTG